MKWCALHTCGYCLSDSEGQKQFSQTQRKKYYFRSLTVIWNGRGQASLSLYYGLWMSSQTTTPMLLILCKTLWPNWRYSYFKWSWFDHMDQHHLSFFLWCVAMLKVERGAQYQVSNYNLNHLIKFLVYHSPLAKYTLPKQYLSADFILLGVWLL